MYVVLLYKRLTVDKTMLTDFKYCKIIKKSGDKFTWLASTLHDRGDVISSIYLY